MSYVKVRRQGPPASICTLPSSCAKLTSSGHTYDATIVGGGFYGATIAVYLAQQRGLGRVLLVEREGNLLRRASFSNQARVHNGYHYPRSFTTGYRSRVNLSRFVRDWPDAIDRDFVSLYAIARQNSKVSARQFERFCREIDAYLEPTAPALCALFNPRLIEKVFTVQEYAFDSTKLANWASRALQVSQVQVRLGTRVTAVAAGADEMLSVSMTRNGEADTILSRYVFNCAYSGSRQLCNAPFGTTQIKHEITELALVIPPDPLGTLGVTVVDGPFFSLMPFPARGLHTLTHVRYTPHLAWVDSAGIDPYARLEAYERTSRAHRMMRDAARYLPRIAQSEHVDSLFEVKTVLSKTEANDARPILFENQREVPGYYAILGAKIDNIYDVLERLDGERFCSIANREGVNA